MNAQKHEEKAGLVPRPPKSREAVKTEKQRAEKAEVAGRHKNSGQKDHKGAR
jgi:hypothetical protein